MRFAVYSAAAAAFLLAVPVAHAEMSGGKVKIGVLTDCPAKPINRMWAGGQMCRLQRRLSGRP